MSPASLFNLTGALRRNKSAEVTVQSPSYGGKDSKAQHLLGISKGDMNVVRNQSMSSVWSTKLANTFSVTTTEFGNSKSRVNVDERPQLRSKASSTLLREESMQDTNTSNSAFSSGLRAFGSSSTLHSFYDRQKEPLAISQQTSDSSRRDFALRKGLPMVVECVTPEQDSRLQLKFFRSPKSRSRSNSKVSTKTATESIKTSYTIMPSQRSLVSSDNTTIRAGSKTSRSKHHNKDSASKQRNDVPNLPSQPVNQMSPQNHPNPKTSTPLVGYQMKVHVRKPRPGAKHWFDVRHDDLSDEEGAEEPELKSNFVEGIETAFQNGSIRRYSIDAPVKSQDTVSSRGSEDNASTPRAIKFPALTAPPLPTIPPSLNLKTKRSKSSISQSSLHSRASKDKASPLTTANLNQDSILDLSSSDEEDEIRTVRSLGGNSYQPNIRDSLASDFPETSDAGVENTIFSPPQVLHSQSPPRLKSALMNKQPSGPQQHPSAVPLRSSSRMLSYLSDKSSEPVIERNESSNSFTATPIDTSSSGRASFISSAYISDDAASIESTRLMSVTRQEESLLAAMRLKKATMKYQDTKISPRNPSTHDEDEIDPPILQLDRASNLRSGTRSRGPQIRHAAGRSSSSRGRVTPLRESWSTLESEPPHLPNPQFSKLNLPTEHSRDAPSRASYCSQQSFEPSMSPSPFSTTNSDGRVSRDTYRSTSTSETQPRTMSQASHVVMLDDLQQNPPRDEVRSQDFISWPYKGWDARAKLATAH